MVAKLNQNAPWRPTGAICLATWLQFPVSASSDRIYYQSKLTRLPLTVSMPRVKKHGEVEVHEDLRLICYDTLYCF